MTDTKTAEKVAPKEASAPAPAIKVDALDAIRSDIEATIEDVATSLAESTDPGVIRSLEAATAALQDAKRRLDSAIEKAQPVEETPA